MQEVVDEIVNMTEMIWETSLGFSVHSVPASPTDVDCRESMLGFVHVNGEWQGTVVLQCSRRLASKMAQKMFDLAERAPSADELHDALSEIANMTAGNLKSILPSPCFLSTPAVVEGNDYRLRVPGTEELSRHVFQCGDSYFAVSLLQKEASSPNGV